MADLNKFNLSESFNEMSMDFGQICRFCLTGAETELNINGTYLFRESRESAGESVCSFMMKLGFIKVDDPKTFPSQICKNCYQLIQICYDFYQASDKSNKVLRECYKNSLNQSQNEYKQISNSEQTKEGFCDSFPKEIPEENQNDLLIVQPIENQRLTTNTQLFNLSSNKLKSEPLIYSCSQCSLKFNSVEAINYHTITTHGQTHHRALVKFQCRTCMKLFSDQENLKKHYETVHQTTKTLELLNSPDQQIIEVEKSKFFCFQCNPHEEFSSQDKLTYHLKNTHKNKPSKTISQKGFTCVHCDATFQTKLEFNEHQLLVHKEEECFSKDENSLPPPKDKKFPEEQISALLEVMAGVAEEGKVFKILCQKCNPPLEFTAINDFTQHIQNHQKKNEGWNCPECPAVYSRKQTLQGHIKEKHKGSSLKGLKCPEPDCPELFSSNRQLILHGINVHQKYFAYFHKAFKKIAEPEPEENNRVKNFECDICKRKYSYKNSLRKHIRAAHLGKTNNSVHCPQCGKTISSKLNLKSHIEFVHEALFVCCPICKKKLNFRSIAKHYKIHKTTPQLVLSKNSFLCNLCGKILKSKRSFHDHQKLHWNIRDEICNICGHGFTSKKFLQLHKKIHEGGVQRKYHRCDQCGKVFSGKHTLKRHILTHSGKKNFICEICSKSFYTLQELNRHVRYHKKEYRFDCQLCDMRFLDKSRFRHHMMRHRNVRPHKCQFCGKMFIVRGKMNLHMASKHNFQVEDKKGVWKDPKTYVPLDDLL